MIRLLLLCLLLTGCSGETCCDKLRKERHLRGKAVTELETVKGDLQRSNALLEQLQSSVLEDGKPNEPTIP